MADIETSIGIGLDTSNALAAIKNLQREISAFHTALAKGSSTAAAAAANLQKDLINNLNATGQFSASMTRITSSTEAFTTALEKNKFSMGEYFRYAGGASKTFGKLFTKEFDTIEKVARERVKDLQTQYIKLGRDANGALQAIKVRPLLLDMDDLGTKTQIAAQKQQIFNQLLNQGSTNLLNFGKNTQWAGRQLMVGFTIPLSIFATTAAKTFMELEKQAIKFKRVYGELFTTTEETDAMVESLQKLSLEFTKYGVAVEKTMSLAADAAAMGKTGNDLLAQVTEANRLAVLGNVEQAQALETTISVTNAFGVAATDLANKINFLNAVENQTVTSIEDLTVAIPKAAPVIKQLGGDVEDLAYFLTAMKEGGINASEGANALKSGLASMINPTAKASEFLKGFGINLQNIVNANKGDVKGLVTDFASALDTLDPLNRAQAIEQLFGKFQFSRLSTLFQNVIAEGTQAERVLALTNATVSDLAALSNKELGSVADSTTFRFQKAIEELRAAIAPVGEQFLKSITPIVEFASEILNKFNSLNEGVKNFVVVGGALIAGLGPVFLMTFGLIANGIANIIKGFTAVRGLFLKTKDSSTVLGEQFDYMTQAQLDAAAVASSLERAHQMLEQRFTSEKVAVQNLIAVYEKAASAKSRFSTVPGVTPQNAGMKLASGIVSVPGPKGAGDIVPAVLSPGEAVIPAKAAQKYAPIIQGMIAGNLPGFENGVFLGMPRSGKSTQKNRDAAEQIYQEFLKSSYANVAPTEYGHQLAQTSGHSFPIFGLGGVYMGPNGKRVFVKPVMDERSALAEMRATQIARQAHGLKAPEQRIVVMRDPQDIKRQRRFLALESALDATFVNEDPMAVFNESQYFKQLVASLLRADRDLSASNVFGDVVADVGPAGVFSRASGVRDYADNLPSMEQQAMINLLGIKGGAKKAFAQSTAALMANLTPQQYHQKMISEIQQVLPLLKQTISSFGLTDKAEVKVYQDMITRLEQGLTVDWSRFHAIHSAVKVPGYENGVVSVPGPKGKGDVVPAMLSPGEAVIPAKMAKKYGALINGMIAGNIPGYIKGLGTAAKAYGAPGSRATSKTVNASHVAGMESKNLASTMLAIAAIDEEFGDLEVEVVELVPVLDEFGNQLTRVVEKVNKKTGEVKQVVEELFDDVKTVKKVKDLDPTKEFMVQGYGFGGTAIPELQLRNKDAYQAAGIGGASFTLQQSIDAGKKAEAALTARRNQLSEDVIKQLELMVLEGQESQRLQESENAATADLAYSKKVAATAIEFAINQDTSSDLSPEQARVEAERRTAAVLLQYEKDLEEGMSAEDALDRARLRLQRAMITASERVDAGILKLTSSESEGAARDLLRMYNTKGPKAIKSGSSRQLIDNDQNNVQRGRPAADAAVRMASVGADGIQQVYENMIAVSAPSAAALADAQEAGKSGAFKIHEAIIQAIKQGLGINSPSRVYQEVTNAVNAGAMSAIDDASRAGSAIGGAVAAGAQAELGKAQVYTLPGLRRVTTDVNVYLAAMEDFARKQQAVFDRIKQQHALLGQSFKNYFASISAQAGPASDLATRKVVDPNAKPMGFQQLNQVAMQTSFAFSSLASVTTMFGAEMGAVNEAMFGMSNALFALTAVTGLLTAAKQSETIATIKNTAAQSFQGISNIFSGGLLNGFKTLGTKVAGFGKNLMAGSSAISSLVTGFVRFLPIIGAVVTAFTIFKVIGDIQEQQKQKIEGMGNAAFAAGEKLKGLASYAGFTPTRDPGSRFEESSAAAKTGITQQEATQAVGIGQTEEFKADIAEGGKFYQDVQNLKNATVQEAQVALQALFIELLALAPEGTDPSAIKATIAAIAEAAGKGDVSLEIPVKLNPFEAGNEESVVDYVNSVQETVPDLVIYGRVTYNKDEVIAGANAFGSAATAGLEQLNTQFGAGLLGITDYNNAVKDITGSIAALEPVAAEAAATKIFENYGVPEDVYSGIKDLNSQLLLIRGLAAGVPIDPAIYEALDAADDEGATPEEKAAGKAAEVKLNTLVTKTLRDQAKAIKDKANAEQEAKVAQDLTEIKDQIDALEKTKELLPDVTALLGSEAEAYKFLADEKWKNLLLDAQKKDEGTGSTANVDALIKSYQELNGVQAEVDFGTALAELREDAALKKELEKNGYNAAEATAILGDEMLQQARIQAIANGTLDQFNKDLEEYINLSGKETTGGGGTPDKTPMEQAVEQLQDQRKEILNTNNAYSKLRQAGVSAGKAFKIAQDPILAAALAAEKVGTKKWKELVALINKVNTSTVAAELRSLTNDNTAEAAATKNIEKVEKYLTKLGYSADQIDRVVSQIGDNPDILQKFVNDMKDGKINAQSIRDYLASIKNIKVELTIEDMEAQVDKAFSDIQAGFAAQREVINLDFETGTNISGKNKINPLTGLPYNTTEINKQIKAAQQYISERQYAIDDYEYQLSGIEEKEASINESYDKRIEALDKVQSLNEKISQGQQDQLSVANALASGDIAAAAEAAQQMQANQAAKALEDQKAAIEAARAAELAGVRSANGLSRIEIEEKIKNLKTEIAKKEEEILEPQSRALELAEDYRDAANDSVDYLGKNETEWKKIEAGVRLAKVEAEGYKKAISDALALIPQLNSGYASAGATNAVDKSKLDSINQKIANAERYKSNMQAQGRWAEFAGATTKLDQYYAERKKILGLASGGSVAGPGTATSDSIPALLSDGEFVVRASSVDRIGTGVLDYINEKGQMPGFAAGGSVNKPKPKPGDAGYYKPRNSSEAIGMGMQIVMDNITRGLFGQAGANSKYGVKNTAGDIIDSAATTALNALPIPAVKALSKLPKAGAAVDKAVASAYIKNTLANPRIAVGMTASGVEGAIKDKALKSLFQVEESGAFITRKTGYDTVRREIERDILGIPLNATSAQRPTYGTVASAFGTKIPYSLTQKMPGLTGDALRLFDPRFNKVTRQYMYSMASNASDVAPMALATTGKGAKGTFTLGDSFRNEIGSSLFNLGNKQDAKTAAQLILKDFKSPVSELRNISPNSLPYVEAQLAPGSNPFNLIKKFGVPVRENNKEYSYYLTRDTAQKEAIKLSNLLKQNDLSKVKTGTFRDVQPAWQHQLAQANLKLRNSPVGRVIRDAPYNLSQMLNNFKKPKNYQGNDGTYIRKPVDFGDNELAMGGLVKPKYFNSGGMVKKYAMGGDVVPSMLTPGEFVMSKYAVKNYGVDTMKAMNSGTLNEGSVYNYSVNVSVQSNSNPDQIARAVMTQIRQIDSQRIRSSNF